MKHFLLVPPFLWDGFETLEVGGQAVAWLQAVPISDRERDLAEREGSDSLEDLFERQQIDVFDLDRPSVV